MKKQTCIIGNILLLMMFLLLSMTAKAQPFTSRVGGDPIYLPDPNVPSPYTLMWAQYSYAGSELYVVNNKVTIEKYFVGTIYVECYYKCVRQYTVAGHVYEDHQTNTTYFGIKCDPVYTTGLPDQLTMQVGETKTIDWSYRPAYVSRPNLTWTSSDYSVVDVNSNKLTAKKSGRAVVTVKSNAGPDEYINVTVEGGSDVIYVNSISLNETSVSLTEGSTKQLQATVLPSNATDKSVSWTSSNNSVAQVSSSGLVTAKSVGTATITCKANDGSDKSATCSVTVKSSNVEPVSIVLPNYIENIKIGQTITLVPTIAPSNATTTLSWTSSDNSVATVTQSGVVKGIKAGESKITVTTSNGKSAYCYVKVTEDVVYVSSISLNATSVTLNVGDTKQLTATISPSNATDKSVSWTSSNNSVATVSSSGMVTAKSTGTVTITCKANDGSGTSATCSVTVKSSTVEPTGITLPYSRTIKVGESFTMTYTLTPSNATTTLTWSSDDSSIATVSSSGVVKGIKAGTTKIRVKTANGKTDYCNVTVESNAVDPTSITLPASKTVKVGESFTMTYTLTPSNATTTLTWSSDDTSIATVSSSGVVKGIKAGTTKIRVKTSNGKEDWCKVTVEPSTLPKLVLSASPPGGQVSAGTTVTLTAKANGSIISGCDIYYMLNDLCLPASYPSSGITINESCRLRAIAYKDGYEDSELLTELYIVKHPANEGYYYVGILNDWDISDKSHPFKNNNGGKTWELTVKTTESDEFKIAVGSTDFWNGNVFGIPFGNDKTARSGSMTYDFDGSENFCVIPESGMKSYTVRINPETMSYDIIINKMEPQADINISSTGYATFYSSESSYSLPNGLSAQIVTNASNNKLTYKTIADGSISGVIPKGTAVMLVSDNKQAGTYTLTASESTATYSDTNLLHGSDEATTTTGNGYHYKLSYGPLGTSWSDVFGWYWGAANGGAFQIEGHKAWLVVPKSAGTRAFSVDGEVMGIETIDNGESATDSWYDLQGRRINQPARKGIYIKNGKKYINK